MSLLRKIARRARPDSGQTPADLERVFFLHLPKCGGTSVDKAMREVYRAAGLQTDHLNPQASARADEVAGFGLRKYREAILLYYLAQKKSHYLSGHFSFSQRAREAFGDWRYVTVLRDPVARWLSGYFYNKYKARNDHFNISDSIEAHLDSRQASVGGCLYVTQLTDGISIDDARTDDAIEQAISTLNNFEVVGVLEQLDLFAQDCEAALGIQIPIQHRRRGPRTAEQQREEVSDETLERIRDLCAPNIRIYEAVRARINERGTWLAEASTR